MTRTSTREKDQWIGLGTQERARRDEEKDIWSRLARETEPTNGMSEESDERYNVQYMSNYKPLRNPKM